MGFLDETGLSRFKGHIDALLGKKQDAGDYATKSYVDTADAKKATLASANTFTGNITAPSFIGSLSGNATSAAKLQTARTIALSGGATGTATSFDGSANISIPVTGMNESYLTWGGRNFTGGYGPIDAAMVPDLGANRLAFLKADGISVQYSTDAGATWTDYGLTNVQKTGIFANGFGCTVGKATGTTITTDCQLRITITSDLAQIYSVLNKFAIYVSTNGSGGCWCTIDGATKANPSTFVTFANRIGVTGWSGWNIINVSGITTYANNDSQYRTLRFTFGITSHNSNNGSWPGLSVQRIMGFGGVGWVTPSNMAKFGSIYSYDSSQNATFPAAITATQFNGSLSGNASTATKATQDGNGAVIATTYLTNQDVIDVCNEVIAEG